MLAFFPSPKQMVFAGLGCAVMLAAAGIEAWRTSNLVRWKRLAWASAFSVAGIALMLVLTVSSVRSLGVAADVKLEALQNQPDLIPFLLPYRMGIPPLRDALTAWLAPFVQAQYETAVFLSWIGLLLCLIALVWARREAGFWLIVLAICVILALGPTLRMMGRDRFTAFDLPIVMPYAFVAEPPLFGYMRTPGRFMLLGYAAFAVTAALGLEQLRRRLPSVYRAAIVVVAALLLLIEQWPMPYPTQTLPPVADFYRQIAADPEMCGILDLPVRPDQEGHFLGWNVVYSTNYQLEPMTHGKGIKDAGEILNFEIDAIDLRTAPAHNASIPTSPAAPEVLRAVYGPGWYAPEQSGDGASTRRWAASPAAIWVYSRDGGEVQLSATPTALHVAESPDGKGNTGELAISVNDADPVNTPMTVGQPFAVPVTLQPGWNRRWPRATSAPWTTSRKRGMRGR